MCQRASVPGAGFATDSSFGGNDVFQPSPDCLDFTGDGLIECVPCVTGAFLNCVCDSCFVGIVRNTGVADVHSIEFLLNTVTSQLATAGLIDTDFTQNTIVRAGQRHQPTV